MNTQHLLIDAGNSRLKWALIQNRQTPISEASCPSHTPANELAAKWQCLTQHSLSAVWIANVAGEVVAKEIQTALTSLKHCPVHWLRAERTAFGLQNTYTNAAQLGADRWAALIGARAHKPDTPLLMVLAGTATTLDVLSAEGCFEGGMILPGLALMHQTLHRETANLPISKGIVCDLPRNTEDAIASGCLYAQAGAIEHIFKKQLAHLANAHCLLSGGNAAKLAALIDLPVECTDNLVLKGLRHIALTSCSPP